LINQDVVFGHGPVRPGSSGEELDLTEEGSSVVKEDEIILILNFSGFESHFRTLTHSQHDI
jgi:hypothetical protein